MVMIDLSKNEYHHMQNYLIYIGVDNIMATLFSVSDHIANLKLHFGSILLYKFKMTFWRQAGLK